MIDSKEEFFSKFKRKEISLEVPGSGEEMRFHALSIKDKEDFVEYAKKHGEGSMRLAGFLIVRASDVFEDDDMEDVCNSLTNDDLGYLSREILRLSGLMKESEEEAEKK